MYRGFDVKIGSYTEYYYKIGIEMFNSYEKETIQILDNFVGIDGIINGSELQENWFANLNADIFLSHSHTDEKLAIGLAGFLSEKFNLRCFIDSCVWGYSNKLLKQIDNRYCRNLNSDSYNYDMRNFSTSHVHMMLSASLNKMIDNCECLFFMNTPNSLRTSELTNETFSPWIYSEILTSKIVEMKTPERYKNQTTRRTEFFTKAESSNEDLQIKYKVDLNHLVKLTESEIIEWSTGGSISGDNALDKLYQMKPALKKRIL